MKVVRKCRKCQHKTQKRTHCTVAAYFSYFPITIPDESLQENVYLTLNSNFNHPRNISKDFKIAENSASNRCERKFKNYALRTNVECSCIEFSASSDAYLMYRIFQTMRHTRM